MERSPLSPLDLVSAKLHRDSRPLDFAVIVRFEGDGPGAQALREGAASAVRAFPPSGSVVEARAWVWQGVPVDMSVADVLDVAAGRMVMEAFIDKGFDPHTCPPVKQLLLHEVTGGAVRLVTRFHHSAFDGMSAAMWLLIQLSVATGRMSPVTAVQAWSAPPLKSHDAPVRKSRYARTGPSGRLWSQARACSHRRRWATVSLDAVPLRAAMGCLEGATYNDLLASSWLETTMRWNAAHGAASNKMGLWLPTNIRQNPFGGFGNGSSRIRVYGRWSSDATAVQRCTLFREQVAWSKAHGEWHIPTDSALLRQPDWLLVPVLRAVLGRPWVDMGSTVFSHVEQIGTAAAVLPMVRETEWVTMLHARFPVGLVGATLDHTTSLSLSWDPGMMADAHAHEILSLFEATVQETALELSGQEERTV